MDFLTAEAPLFCLRRFIFLSGVESWANSPHKSHKKFFELRFRAF